MTTSPHRVMRSDGHMTTVHKRDEDDTKIRQGAGSITPPQASVPSHVTDMISAMIPMDGEPGKYYEATFIKHFGSADQPGSKFTDPSLKSINDVVLLAHQQRGDLEGDDRELFMELGADESAFKDGNRYIMVRTPGTLGIHNSAGMPSGTPVEIVRTKPGAPVSVVYNTDKQEIVDYGVIIITEDKIGFTKDGGDLVITTFPGMVTASIKDDDLEELEGQIVPLGRVREILGGDLWMNSRIVS